LWHGGGERQRSGRGAGTPASAGGVSIGLPGLDARLRRELRDIEKRLRNPETRANTLRMLKEYCPYEVVYNRRRYPGCRMYVGRQTARALLVVREDICRV